MMRMCGPLSSRVLLAFVAVVVVSTTTTCHGFVVPPSNMNNNNRHLAFVSSRSMVPPPTFHHDEPWELPDDVASSSSSKQQQQQQRQQQEEFLSDTRRLRLEREEAIKDKYVAGDDLYQLRQHALSLRNELYQARRLGATRRVHEIEQAILQVQSVDAEFLYAINAERTRQAQAEGRTDDAERFHQRAMEARSALPQFQLEGLWVGKYGDDCYEMINVTYVGDTLVAYKVTGHSPVPSGEISFQANLAPMSTARSSSQEQSPVQEQQKPLEPIRLGKEAAEQWGVEYLQRFQGQGQVASPGRLFADSQQFVDGQLIMVGEHFSFAWIPLNHQVFFGRPSAELTLKMLQDVRDEDIETETISTREHLARCMEETEILEQEMEHDDDVVVYSSNQQDYYNQDGCWE